MPEPSASSPSTSRQGIGIALAVGGNLLVSIALNLTKHAHNVNQQRAVPLPYIRLPIWWCGFAATLLGELGNFAAYCFTEASVIAPLGAVSVLANAFIASLALGEGFRLRDLCGCLLCAAGGIIIVASTPANPVNTDVDVFLANAQEPLFIVCMLLLTATVLCMLSFQESFGRRHVGYYVLLCSLLGSVTVMACKGVSTFLNLWLCCGGHIPLAHPLLYALLFVLVATAVLQIRYLNLAMEHFGNTETVPVCEPRPAGGAACLRCAEARSLRHAGPDARARARGADYVMFTVCTIVISNILYKDFRYEDRSNVACFSGGCVLTFVGVKLLTSRRGGAPLARAHLAVEAEDHDRGALGAGLIHNQFPGACVSKEPSIEHFQPMPLSPGSRSRSVDWSPQFSPGIRAREDSDTSLLPLTMLNTPGMSGDFLRRTFSGLPNLPRMGSCESVVEDGGVRGTL